MSNDVHLARVSKIQRSTDIPKEVVQVVTSRRFVMGRNGKEAVVQHDKRNSEDVEFLFGSTSPRGGTMQQLANIESPDHTQRDTNESDNNISSCSTLDIGKMENLSLHHLETRVRELSQQLQQTEKQRADLHNQLEASNAEKELCFRRLEVVSAAHECRITEMHCVIAELSKKLRAKQESTILEEQEPEGSEISYQEGSIYNSELNLTNPDAECQTDPLDGVDYSAGEGEGKVGCFDNNIGCDADLICDDLKFNDTVNKGQVEALQEEVLHLRAQIALLQSEIANSLRIDGNEDDAGLVVEERQSIEYYAEDVEANESNFPLRKLQQHQRRFATQEDKELNDLNATTATQLALKPCEHLTSPQKSLPIAKMAERVKLRCASKNMHADNVVAVTATDLLNSEIKNVDIVEHLVSDLKQNSNSIMDSFTEPSQLDNELQRLQRKVEHLKVRNTVLSLTLDECKEHCDHLYLLCGKYESNAIALQSAVNCSDRAIEAYDVMLALLESKLALIKDKSVAAEESRKAVESVARHLLDRLESEKNICENSLGPWQNTFSIPDKACAPWTSEDDNRLRYHVSKLKGRRSTVQNTIVNLESPFSDFYEKSRMALESGGKELHDREKSTQMDLEMAVLMQELLNLREENIVVKAKVDDADKERQYAMDRISILQEALKQLQLQLQLTTDSNALFNNQERIIENRVSYSEAEHAALTEQQLVEALTRENELKGRIQSLIASVSVSQKISDEKYEQLHNNVKELQKSNISLSQSLEQNKRKYQTRIRKLEQKIMDMTLETGRQTNNCSSNMGIGSIALQQQQQQQQQRFKFKNTSVSPSLLQHSNVPETTL